MGKRNGSIWWIRRDLRLHDNRALREAAARGGSVMPLFILDPALLESRHHSGADGRKAFLFGGLRALDKDLRVRGSRLVVREGPPEQVLTVILRECGANAIFAEEDYSRYARRRDEAIAACLPLHQVTGVSVHHPRDVKKKEGGPFSVFTPFSRAANSRGSAETSLLLSDAVRPSP